MTNRRLMGALSILLVAVLFMVIGCGDGQRKRPVQPRKILPHGKVNGADKKALNKGGQNLGNQKELNAGNTQDSAIEGQKNGLISEGTLISRDQVASGSFTLNSATSFGKAFVTGKESAQVLGLSSSMIMNGLISTATHTTNGSIASEMDAGREFEIPMTFTVDAQKSTWNGQNSLKVLKSQMDFSSGEFSHEFTSGNTALSLLKALQSATRDADNTYTATAADGRKVIIKILQISSGLRFVLDIQEFLAGENSKKGDLTFTRVLILDYKSETAASTPSPQQKTEPTPAPVTPDQAPMDFTPEMTEPTQPVSK